MRIGIIFTGGTIGSCVGEDGYIGLDTAKRYKLLDMYGAICGEMPSAIQDNTCIQGDIEWVIARPYTILSENLSARNIIELAKCVKELMRHVCDGIIITHGTDTLQYTAAFMGYLLGSIQLPVMMVSSDYPLEDERANGLDNFICAVEFIRQKLGNGVMVSYRNDDGMYIHRGTRTLPHQPYSSQVYSVNNAYYAGCDKGVFTLNPAYGSNQFMGGNRADIQMSLPDIDKLDCAGKAIVWLRAHPCMRYPVIKETYKAVLYESYHSGTLCVDDNFRDYVNELGKRNIPIYISGSDASRTAYESTKVFADINVRILPVMSPVAAYCKLCLLTAGQITYKEQHIQAGYERTAARADRNDMDKMMFKSIGDDILLN